MDPTSPLHTITLTLHAAVPAHRHTQLLHILAGLCAHPPVPILERHLLFKPATQAARSIAADEGGGTQNVVDKEKARRRAEREARERGKGRGVVQYVEEVVSEEGVYGEQEDGMDVDGVKEKEVRWSYRFVDAPEPTVRAVNNRKSERMEQLPEVRDARDAVQAAEKESMSRLLVTLLYRFASQYILTASQFIHNNIILQLQKPLLVPTNDPLAPLDLAKPSLAHGLKPLDPSGACVLEARLEILNAPGAPPSNDLMSQGMKEMNRFRELMKGVVELRAVERMSLNTRVS